MSTRPSPFTSASSTLWVHSPVVPIVAEVASCQSASSRTALTSAVRFVHAARALHEQRRDRLLDLVLHVDLEDGELEAPLVPGQHVVEGLVVDGRLLAVDTRAYDAPLPHEATARLA